ncbi:hypothetical protein [Butyrivibrio sp. JL13D10]|uniref:hypothetical protein n=1 Tax=Butyrivibrio sp. JL13D10 TaxID=3236815 RepID=UPI0038B61D33
MAIVVKVNIDVLYNKVASISDSVKDIRQEIANISGLQQELSKKYWGGDAAEYHFLEYNEIAKDVGPALYSMMKKCQEFYKIAETYDKVEGYNLHAESGKLPTDFLN